MQWKQGLNIFQSLRDNVYSIYAVFGLALAYRRVDDDSGRLCKLLGFKIEDNCDRSTSLTLHLQTS